MNEAEAKAKIEAKQPETKAEAEASRIGLESEAKPRGLTPLCICPTHAFRHIRRLKYHYVTYGLPFFLSTVNILLTIVLPSWLTMLDKAAWLKSWLHNIYVKIHFTSTA